jgi:uncharacterized protein YbbC (DUF1343 family)
MGEHIVDGKDSNWTSIISLYGDNKKPKPEQLAGIDIMVLICKMWETILYVHFFVTLYNGSLCRK